MGGVLPYLVLLQAGFAVPPSVTTDAVRSYRTLSPLPAHLLVPSPAMRGRVREGSLGGLLSVALSVDSRPPGVTWRHALGARTFLHPLRDSDCLADSGAHGADGRRGKQALMAGDKVIR